MVTVITILPRYYTKKCYMIPLNILLTRVSAELDDPVRVRTPDDVLLRALSRSSQFIAIRYRLLMQSVPLNVIPLVPWYHIVSLVPTMILVTDVTTSEGRPLHPQPFSRLRYVDRQWLATTGVLGRYYRIGYTYIGFAPVPAAYETVEVTGIVVPASVTQVTEQIALPENYADTVIKVATGLLLITRERSYQEGLAMIAEGLGIQAQQPAGASA
jgi:hypothetical protein